MGVCLRGFWIGRGLASLLLMAGVGLSLPSAVAASGWETVGAKAWASGKAAPAPAASVSRSVRGEERSFKWSAPSRRMAAFDVIRDLVRGAESPRAGYDAIHHAARRLPSKRPSEMTLAEILAWIEATPGQHHAIGLYQIIPDTLRRLMRDYGISGVAVFSPKTQDALGRVLMEEAGLSAFEAGVMPLGEFADALARVWAGLPMASGRSAYHGIAGNRATITRASFEAALGAASRGSIAPSKGEWREVSSWQ